ncbi:MAG: response regulator, partial [Bdellovibrionota bacterium]
MLHILHVEDSADDAALLSHQLQGLAKEVVCERVDTAEAFRAALEKKPWDIILSDFGMPSFGSTQALEILKKSGRDIPFLVVSGQVGEETAVALMKAGASDYVRKDNPARLVPAVERELREAGVRRARNLSEDALRRSEAHLKKAQEVARLGSWELDLRDPDNLGRGPLLWSEETYRIWGYEPVTAEISREFFLGTLHPDDREAVGRVTREAVQEKKPYRVEYR